MNEMTINQHPLFVALTRPPMKFGVTLTFLLLNGAINLIIFVVFSSMLTALVLGGLLHAFGYLCCLIDPRVFDLLLGQLQCMTCKNRSYWHCNSYEAF